MKAIPIDEMVQLCFCCEHRARALQDKHGPRFECTEYTSAVFSCYMFEPVRPILLIRDRGDRRPLAGPWMFASRAHGERARHLTLVAYRKRGKTLLYWAPTATLENCERKTRRKAK